MDERNRRIFIRCGRVGIAAIMVSGCLSSTISINIYFFAIWLIIVGIAIIDYAVMLGIDIATKGSWGWSVVMIVTCICYGVTIIALNAMK